MTAADFWYARINEHPEDVTREKVFELMEKYAKAHTLSIIEKAVGEEVNRKDTAYLYKTVSEEVGRNILSRVKQELGVE